MEIRLEKHREGYQQVFIKETHIGDILQSEDGFYNFWPVLNRGGYWPSYMLRQIADLVDNMNTPWILQIEKELG